ncbi:SDR family NAD(P)-dependent oxidoreductase [Bosea caraganae]|uniref:SDR family NAD(P)-dependent oxidoreductase n=1 Tax=Bosea caraganae TaxID=2763117 RepID=A0A370L3A2_9HYPH|nr:SDR family oxidoreductase [Bosea caraganae]RDJ22176.1 SDR family NAD(P)-dependent oxidoreductase [Bosea caraganae]RDJ22737.1 SDR family NAD(P)-dependent oxidoreductase [Bosea caraganae]
MELGLKGKVAIVTGGSRGIGLACAKALAAEGCELLLAARGEEGLQRAAADLVAVGAKVATLAIDVTEPSAGAAIVEAALKAFGRLDVVIANAGGVVGARSFAEADDAAWLGTFQLNVGHSVALLRAAVPYLEKSEQGSAVFIASISGRNPMTAGAPYAAAKAGLIHAARSLAWELGPKHIRVNALSPGSILFEGGGWARRKAEMPDVMAAFETAEFPWGRLGSPEEIANVAVFLASPRSTWINAADIPVDGGQRKPSL